MKNVKMHLFAIRTFVHVIQENYTIAYYTEGIACKKNIQNMTLDVHAK